MNNEGSFYFAVILAFILGVVLTFEYISEMGGM